jgi:GMP synthase (glutamine-hydrolysing)
MPRILVFKHVPYEGPATITDWAARAGHVIDIHEWYQTPTAPDELPDYLIIMGGPMNVDEEQEYPWLAAEKTYIRKALDADIPVLGICLGAQLIAAVLGEKVYPGPHRELGWLPLTFAPEASQHSTLRAFTELNSDADSDDVNVFHWHGDTFDLPAGATLLGSTDGCRNQGFAWRNAVGLQFHIEMDQSVLTKLIQEHRLPEWSGIYIASSEAILSDTTKYQTACRKILFRLLGLWSEKK